MVEKEDENDKTVSIILIGSSKSGKTSLILRYTDGFFDQEFVPTLGNI